MSIQDRITYNSAELIQILESGLDKFNTFRFDNRYRALLGDRLIDKLDKWDADIRKQKDSPLTIVVCGEFKRGKSSLINAVLGEDVVTTNVTTETITTNKISYGPHSNEIVLSGGKRIRLSDDELACDRLKIILKELPERAAQLELKRPIDILREVTIIDTPGLGDSMQDFAEDVSNALQQADAVVYVYSIKYPLSLQEQLFIKSTIKPQKYTELFLIGNFTDVLDDADDCDRVLRVVEDRIGGVLPGETPIMVSALDERCRQMNANRPNPDLSDYLAANFDKFRARLFELLRDKRECVIPDRIERLIKSMTADIEADLISLSNGLDMDISSAQERIEELKAKQELVIQKQTEAYSRIDIAAGELKGDAIGWLEAFIAEMEKDVDALDSIPVEEIKKYYSMFCADTLQTAITKCNEYFLASLYDELENIASGVSKNLSFDGISYMPKFKLALQNKTWTSGDNVAFVSNQIGFSSIPLLSTAIDLVAGSMRQKKIETSAYDVLAEIKKQYPALRTSALKSLAEAYSNLAEKAKKQVAEYFDEQTAIFEAQTNQTAMVARQDEENKQKIRLAIEEMKAAVKSISGIFI